MACDDAAPDSNLSVDTAIRVEDGTLPDFWYMSPDIEVNGGTDKLKIGSNSIRVRVRRTANVAFPANTFNVLVEVWCADPGLAFFPNNGAVQIGTAAVPVTDPAIVAGTPKWVPVTCPLSLANVSPRPNEPEDGPWHRCLVARAYPDSLTPEAACFHVIGDQHVAQRNIAVAEYHSNRFQYHFGTGSGDSGGPMSGEHLIRVQTVPRFSAAVMTQLEPVLRTMPNFARLATIPPSRFLVQRVVRVYGPDITPGTPGPPILRPLELPNARVFDRSRPGVLFKLRHRFGWAPRPHFDLNLLLEPNQSELFEIDADLSHTVPGEVTVFNATHTNPAGKVIGGLVILAVRV